jgi:hypothetical protein
MQWKMSVWVILAMLYAAVNISTAAQNNKDPNVKSKPKNEKTMMDIAPFARVITGDPCRVNGCVSTRVREFRAEDVFLENDVCPEKDGTYKVGDSGWAAGCIGLRWLENRWPMQLSVEFAENSGIPSAKHTRVQMWEGESRWQGRWRDLNCKIIQHGSQLVCEPIGLDIMPHGTRKIRWIFSDLTEPVSVKCLSALCPMKFVPIELSLQFERESSSGRAELELYNAEFETDSGPKTSCVFNAAQGGRLKLRIGHAQTDGPSGALLRVQIADEITTISLDDVLDNGCVYVPQRGVFVSKGIGLKEYKQQIAGKKTVLQRVREMPDQTFEQAIAKTHNPAQDSGPMMISLACDNYKFITNRDGSIGFDRSPATKPYKVFFRKPLAVIKPKFGIETNVETKRCLAEGWLPIPVVKAFSGLISYMQQTYVAPFDSSGDGRPWPFICDKPICVTEYTIENTSGSESDALLALKFEDNTQIPGSFEITKIQPGFAVHQKGHMLALVDVNESWQLKADIGESSLALSWKLPPNGKVNCYVSIPSWDVNVADAVTVAVKDGLRKQVRAHWEKVLAESMDIEVPDELIGNVIRASQVHCMLAARNEDDGNRIAAWIASDVYGPLESEAHSVIRGMEFLGNENFARKSLDYFIKRYNSNGFLTTGYTLMGTGWHLWTLGEYFALTQDSQWLSSHKSEAAKVCDWIIKQRLKTEKINCTGERVLEYGLMPPGVIADWNTFAYHYCLNAYYYAGLKAAADALAKIGYEGAAEFQKDAADFRNDILNSYRKTQRLAPAYRLQNGTSIISYPSQAYLCGPVSGFFPGEDANRSWCYDVELGAHQLVPTGVIEASESGTGDMMEHMEDVQFLCSGWGDYPGEKSKTDWYNLGGFSKVQPYYCRNAEIYAMRDDVKPFVRSYFNALASLLNTENLSIWEHFNAAGGYNKTHETGYFLYQTRTMLVTERGDDLWIAPFVTNNWLKNGMSIKVKNAPTRFGKVSYQINSHVKNGYIEAVIEPPSRKVPQELVLRLRHPDGKPLKQVLVNERPYQKFDCAKECIYLTPGSDKIIVRAEF